MSDLPAALAPALAAAVATALLVPGRPGPRRLIKRRGLLGGRWRVPDRLTAKEVTPSARRLHRMTAGAAAVGVLLVIGLPCGVLPAAAAAFWIPIALSRLEPAAVRQRSARIAADLPLAVDLLAACLRAGRPPQAAIGTVGTALDGPVAQLLSEVERRLDLGADLIEAWSCLLAEPACASFARAVQRALRSGAPLARTLERLADDTRQGRRWNAEEQARAVETRAVLPLGLCFLPAFVLLGIVPTIAGALTGFITTFTEGG